MADLFQKGYDRFHWLSFDVVAGACAGMYFFAHLLNQRLSWIYYLLLSMAVWSIYTLDHLLDVYDLNTIAKTPRHQFHQEHLKKLGFVLVLIALSGIFLAFYTLPTPKLTYSGFILGILIVISIFFFKWVASSLAFFKEALTALFYVSGIAFVPVMTSSIAELPEEFWWIFVAYVWVAWINLLYLSQLDRSSDLADHMPSFSTLMGELSTIRLITFLILLTFFFLVIAIWVMPAYYRIYLSILMLVLLAHAFFFFSPESVPRKVRLYLEAAFLLGFLLVFF
ncbi:hypothetical protein [Pararhodonellum marinum]|uniref:hypothetical protein n=1 Tax=Pararhodonellum marinum TaxID=2755358 RepID=UPI00188DDA1E|nr:hypothetical protein [Pararhodonellum marinum]